MITLCDKYHNGHFIDQENKKTVFRLQGKDNIGMGPGHNLRVPGPLHQSSQQ